MLYINNDVIEEVDTFVYLGSVITTNGGADEDVERRIRLTRIAFESLHEIWSSKSISRKL